MGQVLHGSARTTAAVRRALQQSEESMGFGRVMIIFAVLMQAIGKVAYGTWLTALPSNLFVFLSFALTAVFFLTLSRKGVGERAFRPLLLLNVSTALTFIAFFYALKLIEPAIVGAVEIGIGPLVVILVALLTTGERPTRLRVLVCLGILVGCAVLAGAAVRGTGFASFGPSAWLGLGASASAGIGAVLITLSSKTLLQRGWRFGSVLAHRFYLILPVSLALSLGADWAAIPWSASLVATLALVSMVGVLAPLYLLQVGIGRCDPYTVMVTMAALPVLTFLIGGISPAYDWSMPTAVGITIVSGFLLLDVVITRR